MISFYSPQGVATVDTATCTIENDLLLVLFLRAGVQPTLDPYAEAFNENDLIKKEKKRKKEKEKASI